ncbi:MAG: hypothetical protein AAFQ58_23610 [Pseudomonadota bacterium]
MISAGTFLTVSIVAVTSVGAVAFKQFTVPRDVGWLVAGLAAYNASNIARIMLIDQAGLARAMVYSAAGQIILMTIVGTLFGEAVGRTRWQAVALASLAVIAASMTVPESASGISEHPKPSSTSPLEPKD